MGREEGGPSLAAFAFAGQGWCRILFVGLLQPPLGGLGLQPARRRGPIHPAGFRCRSEPSAMPVPPAPLHQTLPRPRTRAAGPGGRGRPPVPTGRVQRSLSPGDPLGPSFPKQWRRARRTGPVANWDARTLEPTEVIEQGRGLLLQLWRTSAKSLGLLGPRGACAPSSLSSPRTSPGLLGPAPASDSP